MDSSTTGCGGTTEGENTSSTVSSCQILPPMSIGKGNYDRAWNDPPVFSVEVNGMGKPVPTKLNKRIAYPGISTISSPHSGGSATLPDPSHPPVSNMQQVKSNISLPTKVDFIPSFPSPGSTPEEESSRSPGVTEIETSDKHIHLDKTQIMNLLMNSLTTGTPFETGIEAEVKKRLEILDCKWDSLDAEVKSKLEKLGACIKNEDFKGAESIQLSLSFEHMGQCGSWIMGIKQILRKNIQ